jgi:hypothetical protein
MRRLTYWWRVLRAGRPAIWAATGTIITFVGGDLLLTFGWGRKHLLLLLLLLPVIVLADVLQGAYREDQRRELEHEADLAKLRAEHQAELTRALAAASRAAEIGRVDPADWVTYGEYAPPDTLMFILRHQHDNSGAVLAFSGFRCAVTDPGGIRTEAADRNISIMHPMIVARYHPAFFPAAPRMRNGTYRFIWEGLDNKGIWHRIKQSTYEVTGVPAQETLANHPGQA